MCIRDRGSTGNHVLHEVGVARAVDVSVVTLLGLVLDVGEDVYKRQDQYIHDAMMTNFRTYLVVGGMPEVVQRFLDTKGDLAAVRAVQNLSLIHI